MKILFVTNNYHPYCGGVVSSIDSFVLGLQNLGHEVRIITLQFLPYHTDDPIYVHRVPYWFRFTYAQNPMAFPKNTYYYIDLIFQEFCPDIVHVHHPFLLAKIAKKIAQKKKIPTVFTHHTMYHEYGHYLGFLSWGVKRFSRKVVKKFCNSMSLVIAPSSSVKKMLINDGVIVPIIVLPTGIASFYFLSNVEIKTAYINCFEKKNRIKLLYVGRMVAEKNIEFLFKICKKLSIEYTLTLVGYGTLYERLQKIAYEKYNLTEKNIIFIHKPEKKQLINYYKNSDLFLFSSTTDTQAIVLAESMSQGCPVIALEGPGQQDIVVNGKNGFLVNSAEEMVAKIECIQKNTELFDDLKKGAYETAKKYDPSILAEKLCEEYKKIIVKSR